MNPVAVAGSVERLGIGGLLVESAYWQRVGVPGLSRAACLQLLACKGNVAGMEEQCLAYAHLARSAADSQGYADASKVATRIPCGPPCSSFACVARGMGPPGPAPWPASFALLVPPVKVALYALCTSGSPFTPMFVVDRPPVPICAGGWGTPLLMGDLSCTSGLPSLSTIPVDTCGSAALACMGGRGSITGPHGYLWSLRHRPSLLCEWVSGPFNWRGIALLIASSGKSNTKGSNRDILTVPMRTCCVCGTHVCLLCLWYRPSLLFWLVRVLGRERRTWRTGEEDKREKKEAGRAKEGGEQGKGEREGKGKEGRN